MEMIPENKILVQEIEEDDTYRPVYVLLAECLGQEAPPPEEVDDVRLVNVPLPQAGPLDDVVGEGGDPGEGGGGRPSEHEEAVGQDEGVDGGGAGAVLQADLHPVLGEEATLLGVSRALLTGRAADREGAAGAGQQGRFDRGQTGGADGGGEEAGPSHPGSLSQHRLPGPHTSHRHQASPGSFSLRHSEGETLRVGPVEPEMFLTAQVSLPTPGALNTKQ